MLSSAYTSKSLLWSLCASIIVHAFVLSASLRFLNTRRTPPLLFNLNLADPFAAGPSETPSESTTRHASHGPTANRSPAATVQSTAPPSGGERVASSEPQTGTGTASAGLGQTATDPGGIAIGSGPSTGAGTSPLEKGSQSGTGPALGPGGASPGGGAASSAKGGSPRLPPIPAIVIPEAIRGTTSPYEGEIYVDVDIYILFEPDMRVGIPVPGNEVCLEGDQIRTIQAITFLEKKTDISKCEIWDYGEYRQETCAPGARTTIDSSNYLSSPVTYSVNFCLLYDKSNCDWRDPGGDGSEREICKAGSEYKGIWAAGTQFHYRCAKSESQGHTHPLQYQVRFMRHIEFPERGMRKRLVHSQTRSISPCK